MPLVPRVRAALVALAVFGSACHVKESAPAEVRGAQPDSAPAAPALRRLTQPQYTNAVLGLFGAGIYVPSNLEPDNAVDGLLSVGASTTTLSAYGVELYEGAAFDIADQVIDDPTRYATFVPCTPVAPADPACAAEVLAPIARAAWRRPVTSAELDGLVALAGTIGTAANSFPEGLRYTLAAILQSPHFLYRVENGTADPADPDHRRLTEWELASRMSFLLWNSIPDEELLAAAEAGDLATDAGLETQARRMLVDDRARAGLRNLFTEIFQLYDLDDIDKDPTVYTQASPELGPAAREETLLGIEATILDDDTDFRDLFIAQRTFVDRRLAALYQIAAPSADGFGEVQLDEASGRRGLLGQGSFLLLQSHATSSSATKRGKFVRITLLCQDIPAPPANVDTSIPEVDAESPTLRDRISTHLENPSCAGCHQLIDPIGLGFENFDGIARWRTTENGATIDASGNLDGVTFTDAWQLGQVVRDHPDLGPCFTRHLYRYSTGRSIADGEDALVDWLAEGFAEREYSFKELLVDTVLSDGFRTVGALQ